MTKKSKKAAEPEGEALNEDGDDVTEKSDSSEEGESDAAATDEEAGASLDEAESDGTPPAGDASSADAASSRGQLAVLAADIEGWASSLGASDDYSVQQLTRALRSEEDLAVWAEVDLDAVLPKASAAAPKAGLRRAVGALRSILVFLPIAFAWLSIREVTSSYRSYTARNPESPVDFLSYWSSPSRGVEQLQFVALAIAFVVALIIVLTVLLTAAEASSSQKAARRAASQERERGNILLRLRLALAPRRKVDVDNIEASLTTAIEGFRISSNQLRESTAQLHEIFDSTDALGPQLERSTQQMATIVQMMQRDLNGSVADLTGQVRALGEELRGIDSTLGRSVEERIQQVVEMTSRTTQEFDLLAQRLAQASLAAEASASRLATMAGGPHYAAQADD